MNEELEAKIDKLTELLKALASKVDSLDRYQIQDETSPVIITDGGSFHTTSYSTGQSLVIATDDSKITGNNGTFKIHKAKLKGVEDHNGRRLYPNLKADWLISIPYTVGASAGHADFQHDGNNLTVSLSTSANYGFSNNDCTLTINIAPDFSNAVFFPDDSSQKDLGDKPVTLLFK